MRLSRRFTVSRQVAAALVAVSTAGFLLAPAAPALAQNQRFDAVHTCLTKAISEFPDAGVAGAHRSREFSYRACMARFGQRA
jgi:hypothetical protein